jgi:hypothetical protein
VTPSRIYRLTSIGRPLEPAYPTNRTVIWLLGVAALLGGLTWAGQHGAGWGLLGAAVNALLAAFGGWALARELAPDHERTAFVALGFALATTLILEGSPVLPLFVALFLVRIVNRSVGLPARISDSILVSVLAIGAAWLFDSSWLALLAALAFMIDAVLPPGLTRQRLFTGLCAVAAFLLFTAESQVPARFMPATAVERWLPVVIAVGFVIVILLTRRVDARGDATGEPLSLARVRAGMWVGLFAAAQSLLGGPEDIRNLALVWASLAGTALHRPLPA